VDKTAAAGISGAPERSAQNGEISETAFFAAKCHMQQEMFFRFSLLNINYSS